MTEEEAKKKWCPQARVSQGIGAVGFNRIDEGKPSKDSFCIASDCMVWVMGSGEWRINGEQTPKSELDKFPTPESAGAVWVNFGICGLTK